MINNFNSDPKIQEIYLQTKQMSSTSKVSELLLDYAREMQIDESNLDYILTICESLIYKIDANDLPEGDSEKAREDLVNVFMIVSSLDIIFKQNIKPLVENACKYIKEQSNIFNFEDENELLIKNSGLFNSLLTVIENSSTQNKLSYIEIILENYWGSKFINKVFYEFMCVDLTNICEVDLESYLRIFNCNFNFFIEKLNLYNLDLLQLRISQLTNSIVNFLNIDGTYSLSKRSIGFLYVIGDHFGMNSSFYTNVLFAICKNKYNLISANIYKSFIKHEKHRYKSRNIVIPSIIKQYLYY